MRTNFSVTLLPVHLVRGSGGGLLPCILKHLLDHPSGFKRCIQRIGTPEGTSIGRLWWQWRQWQQRRHSNGVRNITSPLREGCDNRGLYSELLAQAEPWPCDERNLKSASWPWYQAWPGRSQHATSVFSYIERLVHGGDSPLVIDPGVGNRGGDVRSVDCCSLPKHTC